MVDEAIWNMAIGNNQTYRAALQQGKSATEAAQAAGGQLAVVHRKISDYTVSLEAVLSESKATINTGEAIDKPLEQAALEIISSGAMSDLEKDAAIQQLGALQEWVKHGLREDVTPLHANRIIMAILLMVYSQIGVDNSPVTNIRGALLFRETVVNVGQNSLQLIPESVDARLQFPVCEI